LYLPRVSWILEVVLFDIVHNELTNVGRGNYIAFSEATLEELLVAAIDFIQFKNFKYRAHIFGLFGLVLGSQPVGFLEELDP
jgi:hypothetical protein